ncbi:ABC transporter ATP-binding protein [Paraburkholderia acidisoli]|uniref:ATP-binding cassette domain-containing protein n=1 Tax=Paraburkholderia acidisoli TaxID=2571748 RepID=A0A7Z2JKT5_9BURK|nr:ABC transporter ATP-binding protein [Paraburkholderia acidisoli]QGZ66609.1 ATP-binding cassette domain-containing protein [Paraburkholderia acidisoli]
MSALRVSGLTHAFSGHAVLRGVDFHVDAGTLVALLGPSGSGKTTLLRLLCGFERADAGTIEIGEKRVAGAGMHVAPEAREIGYVPQEGALFPHLSVAQNIVFGLPRAQRKTRHRVAELLELVGLPQQYAERAPQALSGGQQQRVALARALAPAPRLVLLDEPFSALDASARAETRNAVASALAAAGATALLVTHDQAEAFSLGKEVAVLLDGRIGQQAAPRTLYQQPATPELAAFVGEAVVVPGRVIAGVAHCVLGALPVEAGALPLEGDVDVVLRPEQIEVLPDTAPRSDAQRALVREVGFGGRDALVTLELLSTSARVRARVPGFRTPDAGTWIRFAVSGCANVFPRTAR